MKKIFSHIAVFLFLVLCSFPATSFSGERYNNGKVWIEGGIEINYWLFGVSVGQKVIINELKVKDISNLTYFIPAKDVDIIREIMTQYYGDLANSYIPWEYMASVAKMRLQGKSKDSIEKRLELLRQAADLTDADLNRNK